MFFFCYFAQKSYPLLLVCITFGSKNVTLIHNFSQWSVSPPYTIHGNIIWTNKKHADKYYWLCSKVNLYRLLCLLTSVLCILFIYMVKSRQKYLRDDQEFVRDMLSRSVLRVHERCLYFFEIFKFKVLRSVLRIRKALNRYITFSSHFLSSSLQVLPLVSQKLLQYKSEPLKHKRN